MMTALMQRRREMMENPTVWKYVLLPIESAGDGHFVVHPISINLTEGDTVILQWDLTAIGYAMRLWHWLDNGRFAETNSADMATYIMGYSGTIQYTVATGGNLCIGGWVPYQESLWKAYAAKGTIKVAVF